MFNLNIHQDMVFQWTWLFSRIYLTILESNFNLLQVGVPKLMGWLSDSIVGLRLPRWRHNNSDWSEAVLFVLLGRSEFKKDISASPAESMYGEPLCLPGGSYILNLTAFNAQMVLDIV